MQCQNLIEQRDKRNDVDTGPRRSARDRHPPPWMNVGDWNLQKYQQQAKVPAWAEKAEFLLNVKEHFPDDSTALCNAIVDIVKNA